MFQDLSTFSFPTSIWFGQQAVARLPEALQELGMQRPLLVTDFGLKNADITKYVKDVLKMSKIPFDVVSDIRPNPHIEDVEKAAEIFVRENCDSVIGFGGGSALDAAKAVPVAVAYNGPIIDLDCQKGGSEKIKGPIAQVVTIPTTAGTGSEVGRCSVITSTEHEKKFMICSPLMMPTRAILDPELTFTLPSELTAGSGMDAFTHNVEALTVKTFHPMCDGIALKGIEFVAKYLETAVKEPRNLVARGHMLMAATMGAVAFQKDLGATHSMAHPLSTLCDIPHGIANAICLPHVMEFNQEVALEEYTQVAKCFGISEKSPLKAVKKAIEAVKELSHKIGIPDSLSQAGVQKEQLSKLAQKAFEDGCHASNPRPCKEEDFIALFEMAY